MQSSSTFERLASPLGVVVRESESIRFDVYTDEELSKISVVQVNSTEQRDALNRPLPGGLYDPKMGPTDFYSSCPTCGLDYNHCPGHLGRIELVLPVYLPALFPTLVQLMRGKCLHCHSFRAARGLLRPIVDALALLDAGLLVDAAEVLDCMAGGGKRADAAPDEDALMAEQGEEAAEADGDAGPVPYQGVSREAATVLRNAARENAPPPRPNASSRSPHVVTMRRSALKLFYSSIMKAKKCKHCDRQSGAIKQEGGCKIFCHSLSQKATRANAAAIASEEAADDAMSDDDDSEEGATPQPAVAQASALEKKGPRFMTPSEVLRHMEMLWAAEGELLSRLFRQLKAGSFFMKVVPVPPNRFRPPAKVGDGVFEHSSNVILGRVLTHDLNLRKRIAEREEQTGEEAARTTERLVRTWDELCRAVATIPDSAKSGGNTSKEPPGVKQLLERKQGLFRMNMMGKRVNFTCRSVISPDPNIGTHEIGVPDRFAKVLTYPEPITPWNVAALRQAVINGPNVHPGATMVQDNTGNMIDLARQSAQQRLAIAKRLLVNLDSEAAPAVKAKEGATEASTPGNASTPGPATPAPGTPAADALTGATPDGAKSSGKTKAAAETTISRGGSAKRVWRHLRDGDALLLNRQPTLHKPGIMCHRARVLKGEKVIRMHYANCNTYNADFDGDEMNVHMCQTELARAEGYEIASTDAQYIAPTNGKPLRGLIQDHVIMGVLLTKRDTFLEADIVMQLLHLAQMELPGHRRIAPLPVPAIIKPRKLWTGKQVISHLLFHLHPDAKELNMECGTKTPASAWCANGDAPDKDDATVVVHGGELLSGVLDKAAFGASEFGLVHSVHELLGDEATGRLLTQLGRLFNGYQQMHGFTCGIGDLLLTPEADAARAALLSKADAEGNAGVRNFLGSAAPDANAPRSAVRAAVKEQILKGEVNGAMLDGSVKEKLMPLASQVTATCLPGGQVVPFPKNNFAAMTSTGAKGSGVNFSQISAMLGQQELEGRRVPLSPSGCTAPCFAPFELSARAGGYITDRFLTGIRPPEFYFHCMAGREGLVDTAVKTSRSGYLQRCLIKHLEPLQVAYDYTVRSATDGSVVQFVAGEDGLDPTRVSFLQKPEFFARNASVLLRKWTPPARAPSSLSAAAAIAARATRIAAERDALATGQPPPLPRLSEASPGAALGVVSEAYDKSIDAHMPDGVVGKENAVANGGLTPEDWRVLMWRKYQATLQHPGEAVGLLAAQSVGEPSTQMTLNTFHLAGRGEANVTLGIPRMREIIMVASKHPSTPLMTLPLLPSAASLSAAEAEKLAARLASQLTRLTLSEMVRQVTCEERLRPERSAARNHAGAKLKRRVVVHLHMGRKTSVKAPELSMAFVMQLLPHLKILLKKKLKTSTAKNKAFEAVGRRRARNGGAGDFGADEEGREEAGGDEGGDDEGAGNDAEAEGEVSGGGEAGGGTTSGVEDADEDPDDAKASSRQQLREDGADYAETDEDEDDEKSDEEMEAADGAGGAEAEADEDEEQQTDGSGGAGGSPSPSRARNEMTERLEARRHELCQNHGGWGIVNYGERFGEDGSSGGENGHASTLWFEIELPMEGMRILVLPLVESLLERVFVRSTEHIASAVVVPPAKGKTLPTVQTAGVNFSALAALGKTVDLPNVMSNDVNAVLQFYGVEAARAAIVNEIRSVFGVYGIAVDPRHLGLIADYMTHEGGYKPLNRAGIESCASPLQKMSFETTMHFLNQAMLHGEQDMLTSPSASIILGKPPKCGTGSFELHAHLKTELEGTAEETMEEVEEEKVEEKVEEKAEDAEQQAAPPRRPQRAKKK